METVCAGVGVWAWLNVSEERAGMCSDCVCVCGAHVVCRSGLQEKASVGCPPGSSQTPALAVLSPPCLRVFACMLPVPQTFSIRPGHFRLRWLSPKSSRAWNGEGWEELSWGPGFMELNKGQERLEGGMRALSVTCV